MLCQSKLSTLASRGSVEVHLIVLTVNINDLHVGVGRIDKSGKETGCEPVSLGRLECNTN